MKIRPVGAELFHSDRQTDVWTDRHKSSAEVKKLQGYNSNFPICLMTWSQVTLAVYLEGLVAGFLNTLHNHYNIHLLENTARNYPQFYHHY
jgi:hypothetical protein